MYNEDIDSGKIKITSNKERRKLHIKLTTTGNIKIELPPFELPDHNLHLQCPPKEVNYSYKRISYIPADK